MPSSASSSATASVHPLRPNLLALYVLPPAWACFPATLTTLTRWRAPVRLRISGSRALVTRNGPVRSVARTRSHVSTSVSAMGPQWPTPALFTSTSTPGAARPTSAAKRATLARSVTSRGSAWPWPPARSTSRAASSSAFAERAPIQTVAPSLPHARASARPIPLDAPVTTTCLPLPRGSAMQTPPRPERKSPAVTKLKVWPQARNAAGGAPLPDSHDPWRPAKPPTSRPVASRWAARGLPVASCGDARRLCAFPARCPSHGSEDGRLGAAPGGRRGDPLRRGQPRHMPEQRPPPGGQRARRRRPADDARLLRLHRIAEARPLRRERHDARGPAQRDVHQRDGNRHVAALVVPLPARGLRALLAGEGQRGRPDQPHGPLPRERRRLVVRILRRRPAPRDPALRRDHAQRPLHGLRDHAAVTPPRRGPT